MRGLWYRNYHVAACRQHNSKHTQLCSAEMSSWGKKMHYRCDVWPLLTRISDGHVFWTRSLVKLCSAAFGVQCKSLTRIMEIIRRRLVRFRGDKNICLLELMFVRIQAVLVPYM